MGLVVVTNDINATILAFQVTAGEDQAVRGAGKRAVSGASRRGKAGPGSRRTIPAVHCPTPATMEGGQE